MPRARAGSGWGVPSGVVPWSLTGGEVIALCLCRHWVHCNNIEGPRDVLAKLLNGTAPHCKYLLWRTPGDGLGNRMINLVATFAYALLTKRIFLVDDDLDVIPFARFFCEPFKDSPSWIFPDMVVSKTTENDESNDNSNIEIIINTDILVPPSTSWLLPFLWRHSYAVHPCFSFHLVQTVPPPPPSPKTTSQSLLRFVLPVFRPPCTGGAGTSRPDRS